MRSMIHKSLTVAALSLTVALSGVAHGQEATVSYLGQGYGPPGSQPFLQTSTPHLGSNVAVWAFGLVPEYDGFVAISLLPLGPTQLPGGGALYLDLQSVAVLAALDTDGGGFEFAVGSFDDPTLLGLKLVLQYVSLNDVGDVQGTNGVRWTLGY